MGRPKGSHPSEAGKNKGGRPKGIPNKATIARQMQVAAGGITPLDYILSVMRDETADQTLRLRAADSAAMYVHPRLTTTVLKGDPSAPLLAGTVFVPEKIPDK